LAEIDPVILQLRADVAKYRADVEGVTRRVNDQLGSQERAVVQLETQIKRSSQGISSSFRTMAASLAAGVSTQQVAKMADSYTRFSNQLKVAGLEGQALAETQQRLFDVAQQNGVEVEAVGTLYSRAAQNQRELGASTEDLINLTRAVSASLRISGTDTNEASGALLQLGQALGSPRVEAEEFNSLLDTMQPLLREAAKYIDGTGNSLAGLTRKIKDQNGPGVSNVELFRAITRAMQDLERTAAGTTLTIAGAFTNLSNALTKFIGEADAANGATAVVTGALNALAQNLDVVTEAVAVLAAVMVGRFAAGMVTGAAATASANAAIFALQARAAGAATSMEALAFAGTAAGRSLLAAFGGPIGLAVTTLTVGVGYLLTRTDDAAEASGEYARQQQVLTAIQGRAAEAANAVAFATGKARAEALANAKALQQETQQYIANAKAAVAAARAKASEAAANARTIANSSGAQSVGTGSAMIVGGNIVGQRSDRAARQAATNLRVAQENLAKAEAEEKRIGALVSGLSAPAVTSVTPASPAKASGTASSAQAKDIAAIAKRFQDDLAQGEMEIRQAQADALGTSEARRALEADRVEYERQAQARAIKADDDLTAAQKEQLLQLNERVAEAKRQAIGAQALAEATEQARAAAENSSRYEQAALEGQLRLVDSRQERLAIEQRILASMEREEKDRLEAEIAAGRIADAAKARADLASAQASRREIANRDYESPLEQRRREVRETAANMGDAIENIEIDAVDRLTEGLANASTEFIKLGGIAGDVLNSIISDFVRLAAQQAIFGSGGAGSGGGLLGSIGKLLGFSGARAAGGPVTGGQTYLVGEKGPELFRASTSGTIVPNHQLNATAAASMTGVRAAVSGATGTVAQALHFDLRGAVVTEDLLAQMNQMAQEAAIQGAQGGRALAARDLKAMSRPRM